MCIRDRDADPKINMDEKEATPVEDVEVIPPPMEPNRPVQTEEEKFRETMMRMLEQLGQQMNDSKTDNKKLSEKIDDSNKKLKEELKTDNQKSIESLKEELSGKIDNNSTVSYTHLDVYKRQSVAWSRSGLDWLPPSCSLER